MKTILTVTLLSIFISQVAIAATDSFSQAYMDYKDAIESNDWESSLVAAKLALAEGLKIFDESGENIANLRLNYANELIRIDSFKSAAELLVESLNTKTNNLGSDSIDLIEVLMPLGKSTATFNVIRATNYFRQALEIVSSDPALTAKLQLDAGLSLFAAEERENSRKYLIAAQSYYEQRFGIEDFRSGLANINLGRIYYENEEFEQAEFALGQALQAFQARTPASQQFANAIQELFAVIEKTREIISRSSIDPVSDPSTGQVGVRGRDH